jgi:hypothetical protein
MLTCQVSLPARVQPGEAVPLHFRLGNPSGERLWVLGWQSPLEGLRHPFVEITGPRGAVAYGGPMFKRGDPDAAAYHLIPPGEHLDAIVDLRLAYDFDASGRYRVRYVGGLLDVVAAPAVPPRDRAHWRPQLLHCQKTTLIVSIP